MRMIQAYLLLAGAMILTACATTSVKSTEFVPAVQNQAPTDEALLMDVGVLVFDPGIDEIARRDVERVNLDIRLAESRYAPHMMAETLQRSGNWGVVRILPHENSTMDIYVQGQILLSNGEGMVLNVTVTDATGREWFSKLYEEHISRFSYERGQRQANDPFQVIYNQIANDIVEYRDRNLSAADIANIRTVSELQFAANFAPEIFGDFLSTDARGITLVERLPADNDPMFRRLRDIRERDHMFVDTVQDYYDTYARQMRGPYDAWREMSYQETMRLEAAERSARQRFILGTAAIVGGIAGAASGSSVATTSGMVGVGAGAYLVRSGFDRSAEARMHIAALQELGESLEAEMAPRVIDLEDRSIMLTGTVEEQYEQWRELLVEMYRTETGE